ncbi:MAG: outer membrane protein assembly factor BamB [Pseudoxanthomonas sp.]
MKTSSPFVRGASVLLMAAALASCSTVKGWFSNADSPKAQEKKASEPVKLADFTATAHPTKVWKTSVGHGEKHLGLGQVPAVADGRVYAAGADGSVFALDLQTGREVWRYKPEKRRKFSEAEQAKLLASEDQLPDFSGDDPKEQTKADEQRTKQQLKAAKMERKLAKKLAKKMAKEKLEWRFTGGPGAGDGLVVIGTLDGQVVALDAASGEEKWHAKVPNEVIAAPVIGQGYVLVRSNDGAVSAFDAATGERRWISQRELPSLTVRGNGSLTLGPNLVFSGNDDGTVSALSLSDGRTLWEQAVGLPEGRSELDRMADVDAAPVLDGVTLYASSYKKETVALDGPSGRPLWVRDNGGGGGVGMSASAVVVSDPGGVVWALDKNSGGALWSNSNLARRSLTAPTVQGDYAVVGDYDGYVHWLRLDDGEIAARARVGGDPVRAKPVLAGDLLLVQNTEGEVTAFRLQ